MSLNRAGEVASVSLECLLSEDNLNMSPFIVDGYQNPRKSSEHSDNRQ